MGVRISALSPVVLTRARLLAPHVLQLLGLPVTEDYGIQRKGKQINLAQLGSSHSREESARNS